MPEGLSARIRVSLNRATEQPEAGRGKRSPAPFVLLYIIARAGDFGKHWQAVGSMKEKNTAHTE